jgi:hypothetical protein
LSQTCLDNEIAAQRQLQEKMGLPFGAVALDLVTRHLIGQHFLAPAVAEAREFGVLPPGSTLDLNTSTLSVAGISHQKLSLMINWAQSDHAILKSIARYLKAKRPHSPLKIQNLNTAPEHLKRLSALRLLQHLSGSDAARLAAVAGIYSDERALRRAKKSAQRTLQRLFPD